MNWTFERSEAPEFIRVIGGGLFSSEGFTRMFDALFALEYWQYRVPLVIDVREVDLYQATSLELLAASNHFIAQNNNLSYTKIAVLFKEGDLELAGRFGRVTMSASQAWVSICLKDERAVNWITTGKARLDGG